MSLLAESGLPECQLLAKRAAHSVSEISELGIKYFLIDHLPTRNRYVFGDKKILSKVQINFIEEKNHYWLDRSAMHINDNAHRIFFKN